MSPAHRRALARVAAGPALAGLLLVPTASAAAAHDELVGSDPAPGAALDSAPAAVRLDYSADVLTFGAAVVVADADGTWQTGEPVLDGSSVSVALDPAMPDGAYEVRWRVVSSDGHPITGLVPFTVGDVAPAPAGDPVAEPTTSPAADAVPDPSPTDESVLPWRTLAVAGGGAVLALAVYAAVLLLRGRRAPDASR